MNIPPIPEISELVGKAKEKVFSMYYQTEIYRTPFRFALEIYHRALFQKIPLRSPSLELGISNGVASHFIFSERGHIDFGTDMPGDGSFSTNTLESRGVLVDKGVNHYRAYLGADGQNIPFPDNSFATVVCNQVMGQGMDRFKMVKEMVRVLAPGGALAFTENTSEVANYPLMLQRIERFNPFRGKTVDEDWYLDILKELGMEKTYSCQFMRSAFGVALMYMLFSAKFKPPEINHPESPMYRMYLESMLPGIIKELENPEATKNGIHMFVCAFKPGELDESLPTPSPRCPSCYHTNFSKKETSWLCMDTDCQAMYPVAKGVPLLVKPQSPLTITR